MACGYVCHGCGRCKGEAPPVAPGSCPSCGTVNEPGETVCVSCGGALPLPPGIPQKSVISKEDELDLRDWDKAKVEHENNPVSFSLEDSAANCRASVK